MEDRAGRNTRELEARVSELEEENRLLSLRYVDAEQQATNIAQLFVAGRQLRNALTHDEILMVIQEIVANIVGCEELAIFECESGGSGLRLVRSMGVDAGDLASIKQGEGVIGQAVRDGEIFMTDAPCERKWYERDLTACIPLSFHGHVRGAVALFRLLPQKHEYGPFDRELFESLSHDAACALYVCALREESRRGDRGES